MGSLTETVMQFIEQELKKDPDVKNATLFAGACEIDESIKELNARQFHAKYPLQVKRRMAPKKVARRRPARRRKPAAAPAPAPAAAAPAGGEDVMGFVVRMLEENPDVKNADLFEGACKIDPSIKDLSARQFHATYPLQVKRRMAKAAPAPAPAPPPAPEPVAPPAEPPAAAAVTSAGEGDPAAVRDLLLDLARELAAARSQAETIEVMARLDVYVADIMKAARS